MFPSVKKFQNIFGFLALFFLVTNAFGQYGVEREIRLAKEAKEDSERRIEQSKEMVDQGLDDAKAVADKNIDAILLATSECKKTKVSQKKEVMGNFFVGLDDELTNYQVSFDRKKQALERIAF